MASDYTTPESLAALSKVDPEIALLLPTLPPSPTTNISMRQMNATHATNMPSIIGNVDQSELRKIPMRDGYMNEIRTYGPKKGKSLETVPLFILICGGGFVNADNKWLNPYARAISALYDTTVVSISYRCAPKFKFPFAANDAWDSLEWITSHAAELGANPVAGLVLGGVSAGANLAAVTCQKSVSEKFSPPLTGLWLGQPFILDEEIVPQGYKPLFISRRDNQNAPLLNDAMIRYAYDQAAFDVHSPKFSPFNATNPHIGMPPTYIQVCGLDPLRDDGLIYERALRENGVSTRMDVYSGVPHGHYAAWPYAATSRKWDFDVVSSAGWLLDTPADPACIIIALDGRHGP
ncbi:AB hydrolase superfamily protein [Penicillium argentinense]|uniref:AB hydrolase superfamily protein n=1 Tax=Penicillium argentinense TaxID=1131581 RepID=A0A9W9FF61_9EURO|nr:AB hydrolase superfamily protein [Penicillium argentinense]KAJ5098950.1 AB hydrolase superfamily protein [Penicillium argentinense]